MNVDILQHAPFEGLGWLAEWLQIQSADHRIIQLYLGEPLPPCSASDLLIALGGPMSVHDVDRFPWLLHELSFLRRAIDAGQPVLGICLGAQLMAASLGSKVWSMPHREIGWFPIKACIGTGYGFRFPAEMEAFHWHGDSFDLPAGAHCLARSAACDHQAFQFGSRAIGLQFHLETTRESLLALLQHCPDDLEPGPWVQSSRSMRDAPALTYSQIHLHLQRVLNYLIRSEL